MISGNYSYIFYFAEIFKHGPKFALDAAHPNNRTMNATNISQPDLADRNWQIYIITIYAALFLGGFLGVLLLLAVMMRFKQNFKILHRIRLKRFKASVVSVNPEYTPIWSWDPFSQGDMSEDTSYEIVRSRVKVCYSLPLISINKLLTISIRIPDSRFCTTSHRKATARLARSTKDFSLIETHPEIVPPVELTVLPI